MGVRWAPENLDQVGINLSEAHPSREPDLTMVGVPSSSGSILATSASTAIHVSHSPFLKSDKIHLEGLEDDGFLPTADADFRHRPNLREKHSVRT